MPRGVYDECRRARGEHHHAAKLRDGDVVAIRQSAASLLELAKDYDVHPSTISLVRARKIWRHI
jgi:hypothetical protein